MKWNVRTILRSFLVAGGIVYVASGVLTWTPLYLAIGAVATAVGLIGLWMEYGSETV